MENDSEEPTLFPVDSLAKMCPSQGKEKDSPKPQDQDCGTSSPVSFAKLDQDGSWLKMSGDSCQIMMDGTSEKFLEPWPTSGIMRNGVCEARLQSEPPTDESESGLWPTPDKNCGTRGGTKNWTGKRPSGAYQQKSLNDAAKMWPTPQAHDAAPGNPKRVGRYGTKHGCRNPNDEAVNKAGGQLNPTWVELLMGWPPGWTVLI